MTFLFTVSLWLQAVVGGNAAAKLRPALPHGLVRLDGRQIRAALTGRTVSYSPPGWADAGASETFYPDGRWAGLRLSRGPLEFAGRWWARAHALCVVATSGLILKGGTGAPYCRAVWRNPRTGDLMMDHVSPFPQAGLQKLHFDDPDHRP
jgi:hypothetical protein